MRAAFGCLLLAIMAVMVPAPPAYAQWGEKIRIREREYRVATADEVRELGIEVRDVQFFRNSAFDYLKAMNAYVECPEEIRKQYRHVMGKGGWQPDFKELAEWIESNEKMIEELKKAVKKEFFVLPVLNREGGSVFDIMLPHLSQLRNIARFLKVRSKYQMAKGDFKGALESWWMTMRMSEHANQDRFLMSGLVAIAVRSIAVGAIQDQVLRHDLTTAQLKELGDMLQPFYERPLTHMATMESEHRLVHL